MPLAPLKRPHVVETKFWLAKHPARCGATGALTVEPGAHPHLPWVRLVCPCGARHTCDRSDYERERR